MSAFARENAGNRATTGVNHGYDSSIGQNFQQTLLWLTERVIWRLSLLHEKKYIPERYLLPKKMHLLFTE